MNRKVWLIIAVASLSMALFVPDWKSGVIAQEYNYSVNSTYVGSNIKENSTTK